MKGFIRIFLLLVLVLSFLTYACAPLALPPFHPFVHADKTTPRPFETTGGRFTDRPAETELPVVPTPAAPGSPVPSGTPALPPIEPKTAVPTSVPTAYVTRKPISSPTASPENNTVYLTFDDGPCRLTTRLLDILDEYNIKATFFTVGYFVDRHPEIVRDAASRGHLIGCHTYSHDYPAIYRSADAFMEDVHNWEKSVINALGALPPKLCLRFPGGSKNAYLNDEIRPQIIERLNAEGWCWYDWNFGDNDKWLKGNTENLPIEEYLLKSYRTTLRWVVHGQEPIIFLAHDTCEESVNIMNCIIDDLITGGFNFATLQDCPLSQVEM